MNPERQGRATPAPLPHSWWVLSNRAGERLRGGRWGVVAAGGGGGSTAGSPGDDPWGSLFAKGAGLTFLPGLGSSLSRV